MTPGIGITLEVVSDLNMMTGQGEMTDTAKTTDHMDLIGQTVTIVIDLATIRTEIARTTETEITTGIEIIDMVTAEVDMDTRTTEVMEVKVTEGIKVSMVVTKETGEETIRTEATIEITKTEGVTTRITGVIKEGVTTRDV